jgi:hypothetical protein
MSHPLKFYTTAAMETRLNAEHKQKIREKNEEMNREGYRGKYNASIIVGHRPTRFTVKDGVVTLGGERCPEEKQSKGGVYEVVPRFVPQVLKKQIKYDSYEVSTQFQVQIHLFLPLFSRIN